MIINKIEIAAFGKFKNHTVEFTDGINAIYGENETGKSTICAFIFAMFYDFAEKDKNIRNDLRKRYTPISGDDMAGTVYFTHEGKCYILKRQFGATPVKSRVTLLDGETWEEIRDERRDKCGEYFFGVSAGSFLKTFYISQLMVPFSKDKKDELWERISNINSSGDEEISYRKTMNFLQKQAEELISKSGSTGKIVRLKEENEELCKNLVNAKEKELLRRKKKKELNALNEEKERLCQECEMLEKERAEKSDINNLLEEKGIKNRYEILSNEIEKRKTILGQAKKRIDELDSELSKFEEELGVCYVDSTYVSVLCKKAEQTYKTSKIAACVFSVAFFLILGIVLGITISVFCLLLSALALGVGIFAYLKLLKGSKEIMNAKKELREMMESAGVETVADFVSKVSKLEYISEEIVRRNEEYLAAKQDADAVVVELWKLKEKVNLSDEEINGVKNSDFELSECISSINIEISECEKKILEAQWFLRDSEAADILEIEAQIQKNELEIQRMSAEYNVFCKTLELMEKSYNELKNSFAPKLLSYVHDAVSFMTDGKYSDIRISDDYKFSVMADGEIMSGELLSGGTYDIMYFALRAGFLKVLSGGKIPFMVLDDCFLQMDIGRIKNVVQYIKKENPAQVLYFTCREELKDIFGGNE